MGLQQENIDDVERRLRDLQGENELLLMQIYMLEEELEYYYMKNQKLKRSQGESVGSALLEGTWGEAWGAEVMSENQRLQALIDVLRKKHELEIENALNVKLGNILIHAVDHPVDLFSVPGKLIKIWRESARKRPPKRLGGKEYKKVIDAYGDGGFDSVHKLLTESLSPSMKANGYMAVARHIMNSDPVKTAEAARFAYECDPQDFRLKWLAFRLHEAGSVIEAEAILNILPTDVKFSESELRQVSSLKYEAKHIRESAAKRRTGFIEFRNEKGLCREEQEQLDPLQQLKLQEEEENELLLKQLFETQQELENVHIKYQALKIEKDEIAKQKEKL